MSPFLSFLITVLYGDTLLKCALKFDKTKLPEGFEGDWYDYPMEPDSRELLHKLLPLNVRNCGPIVAVDRLFEVAVVNFDSDAQPLVK